MRQIVDWHAEWIESSRFGWLVYFAISAVCVAFIYWNMTTRFETFDATYELITERAVLEREYEALTEHYSRDELRKLLDQISSAETSIFRDYASLATWLGSQADVARQVRAGQIRIREVCAAEVSAAHLTFHQMRRRQIGP